MKSFFRGRRNCGASRSKYLYDTTILDLLHLWSYQLSPNALSIRSHPVQVRIILPNLLCARTEPGQNSHSPSPLFSFDSLYGLNPDLHTFPLAAGRHSFCLQGLLSRSLFALRLLPPDLNDFELLTSADIALDFICRLVRVLEVPSSESTSRTPFPNHASRSPCRLGDEACPCSPGGRAPSSTATPCAHHSPGYRAPLPGGKSPCFVKYLIEWSKAHELNDHDGSTSRARCRVRLGNLNLADNLEACN